MTDRMDVIAFIGEKNFPRKVGTAVPRRDGNGFQLYLDTVPVGSGWDGSLVIQPPRDREAAPQRRESDDTPW